MLLLLLAGCIPRPRHPQPLAPPPVDDARAYRQCLVDLSAMGAKVDPLPDRIYPNGCSATHAVKLVAIGIPVANLGAVKCGLARPFVTWTQQAVQQAARARLGSYVTKIESFGSFACRPVNGVAGNRLSEHGRADAIDIAAFDLADGRRITVKDGWNGPDRAASAFLHDLHAAACRRFNVVLGPDANAYHHDHMHFDMGSGPYCR
ncbi:extensin family protein [Sphingomonas nostoxanthinifaciens]|uniref:extensin family protein n=1 Tax=Sphingomonas nostoxanthinifaciens TaxID=2872652 RepID=UPI001CC1E932|nr:extensin family protein [Sphingomonas nostoxanthinifaciens]